MPYFILKNKLATEATTIILRHQCHDKRLVYSTGLKIIPKKWNHNKQKINGRDAVATDLNNKLKFIKLSIDKSLNEFARKEINPSRDELKQSLLIYLGKATPEKKKETVDLLGYIDIFIRERMANEKEFKSSTVEKYHVFKKKLLMYAQKMKGKRIEFDQITHEFHQDFIAFLYNEPKINSKNAVSKYVKILKLVMKQAQARGYHNVNHYRDFEVKSEISENIYLTSKEIDKLYGLKLSVIPRLERVRDLFIIGCETGLRFSDWNKITKNDITTEGEIEIVSLVTEKTSERVDIPLSYLAKSILKKYDYTLPSSISNQKTNKYLKEIGELAGFKELISLHRGGKDITEEKYKLISTHTARRSFATNAYLAGLSTINIMKITGHKSESSFMKYIKMTKREAAIKSGQHDFFSKRRTNDVKLKKVG